MDPGQLPSPPQINQNPELGALAILDSALEISATALLVHYPEIPSPDWPRDSCHPPDPPTYAANFLLVLLHATRDAARSYRETVMRPVPRLGTDLNNTPTF